GHDWCIVRLGAKGIITRVEIDTTFFRGNYPESCTLEGGDGTEWRELLPMSKLQAHTKHIFTDGLADLGPVTNVRFNIYPDGGVSRLRLFGRIA
ncbi:MAG: hypothetical protein WBC19_11020, partial [Pyrinomonadaceae bacterium]